ncbi:3-hydroxyacyl-CoA dehydrogenase family protein [Pseudonocardia nigra]|uniref:3-hydroxyacyl-CoA dehydrogenase family protein n=1 Tax=Pseudonocardia nigra TaxID=1921578 RepID=UPI001C5F3587|nr:3-hydroxyacyl-CoA dehydrogenase family protein [Pseudonocardia nigra]
MKVSVLGAGVMGSGIAQVLALAGHPTVCYDLEPAALDRARKAIRSGRFGLDSAVQRGKATAEQAEQAESRIRFTADLADTVDAELVIEAVPERLDLKIGLFRELDRRMPPDTVLASNSSGFPICALAAATERPDKVVGWHWASPPPVMRLAEIVRAPATSDETVALMTGLARDLGKNPIVVKDTDKAWGYVANRVYRAVRREAESVVQDGIATPEEVDQLLVDCFRWPAGPYTMAGGARSGWA